MTYDTVSYEVCITEILPGHGAIMGGKGPIQNRADFERYPWDELPARYWADGRPKFDALARHLPRGMKALGGVGNGVFEISEDLVGFEYLAYLQADDPDLFAELYRRIGDLMVTIWTEFLPRYGDVFAICRFGDDLGFKTSTLVSPDADPASTSCRSTGRVIARSRRRASRSSGTPAAASSRSWTT